MSGTEALARVLAAADGLEDGLSVFPLRMTRYWSSAQAIVADPGPLLAALAEAGVLTERHQIVCSCGSVRTGVWTPHLGDVNHHHEMHRERCFVTDWEATDV